VPFCRGEEIFRVPRTTIFIGLSERHSLWIFACLGGRVGYNRRCLFVAGASSAKKERVVLTRNFYPTG
jgi:hypothetical protein